MKPGQPNGILRAVGNIEPWHDAAKDVIRISIELRDDGTYIRSTNSFWEKRKPRNPSETDRSFVKVYDSGIALETLLEELEETKEMLSGKGFKVKMGINQRLAHEIDLRRLGKYQVLFDDYSSAN
ncbi:hypothetical protein J4212_00760 [Candidatus Woesearchaeota archaeon]|nr:hypothetical protein [Candidatus Woesearchaeota archaeon]